MYLTIPHHKIFCYTGGKEFDASKPSIVFIHGVLNDHSAWILQTRYFAHHGFNVLAPDLPGHGKSAGEAPRTVQEAAQFVFDLMDALQIHQSALVGHSFGSLTVLEAAAQAPSRVTHLALVGTAYPMKVSPALLDASLNKPLEAIDMVNQFSHASLAPPPSTLGPGTWLYGGSRALMRRVLASNSAVNVFHRGFTACNDYSNGEQAMATVAQASVPVHFILGGADQMTLPKMAALLQSRAPNAQTTILPCGHALMAEAPDGVLFALLRLLKST